MVCNRGKKEKQNGLDWVVVFTLRHLRGGLYQYKRNEKFLYEPRPCSSPYIKTNMMTHEPISIPVVLSFPF